MRKRPLLWFACVFLCGLAFERYGNIFAFFACVLCIGIEVYHGVRQKIVWKLAGRSMVLLSVFLLGMWHMKTEENFRMRYMSVLEREGEYVQDIFEQEQKRTSYEEISEKKLETETIVWGEIIKIENTDYGVRMILSDCYISLNEEKIPCNDIMVYASSDHFRVGEIHKIKGQLNQFEHARNQGNFDSKIFYQSQKIDFSIQLESNTFLGKNESVVKRGLLVFKESLLRVYESCMDEKTAGFYAGMILGDKTGLEEEIKELFTLSGISHILAISGLHVSMIGRNSYTLLRKGGISFLFAGIFAGSLLLAYGYLVGNGMSAVRAIGMMFLYFLGQYIGRSYDMLNALGAMVLVLLWENPFLMEYSGFWFSVMALLGVGFTGDVFSKEFALIHLHHVSNKKVVSILTGGMGMSLGITLTTLPVVAYCYYEIPLYSPIVNAVVLPLLTPIFMLALGGGLIGLCVPVLAKVMLIPCSWGLEFYIWLCECVEHLPGVSIICGKPKNWVIVIYCILLVCCVCRLRKRQQLLNGTLRTNKFIILISCLALLGLIIYPKELPCEITFLDVGQGDGIYISTGDEVCYFIDGGSSNVTRVGEYRMLPFLKYKDIDSIDYWFVSHADEDHISGLMEVIESGYNIRHLVVSKYAPRDENTNKLVSMARNKGINVIYMDVGDAIQTQNSKIECLYPSDDSVQDKNDASMVLELEICMNNKIYKAFFAGDISSNVEQTLLKEQSLENIWLYKASHHGSKYSNSEELLRRLAPKISVISCAAYNTYGHPGIEAVANMKNAGSNVLYTMKDGQISVCFENNKIKIFEKAKSF